MIDSLLIIQTGFLGDAVLATGMLRAIHAVAPSVRIGFLVREEFSQLFGGHPGISSLHAWNKRLKGGIPLLVEEIKKEGYAATVVPHRSFRSALIPFRAGIGQRIGFRQSDFSLLFTKRIEYNIALPEIDRNASLLQALNIEASPEQRRGWLVPSRESLDAIRLPYRVEGKTEHIVLIAPGSVWETKRWPAEKFSTLAAALRDTGYGVFLVGSNKEKELCAAIAGGAGLSADRILAGKLSLTELAALCSVAVRVFTNDSAPLHIAESVGTPVTALFGPTVPEFGFAPYLRESTVLERRGLACRPCGIHGHEVCPIGTHECMTEIPVESVVETLQCAAET